jgi:hypothetical protein
VGGLILAYTPPQDRRFVGLVLVVALGLKIAIATLYQSYLFSGGFPLYAPDGEGFSKFGWYISRVLLGKDPSIIPSAEQTYWNYERVLQLEFHGVLPPVKYQTGAYTYFIGFLYALFGYSPLLGRLINIVLSSVSAFLVMRVAADQVGRRGARLAFFLVLFWPSMFLFSLSLLRDTAILLLIVVVVWSVQRFVRGTPVALFGLFGAIMLIGILRRQAALLLIAILVLWASWYLLRLRRVLILGVVIGVFTVGLGQTPHDLKDAIIRYPIRQHAGFLDSGGIHYNILPLHVTERRPMQLKYLLPLTWSEVVVIYFRGVGHYMTEPWPSHLKTLKLKAIFPQMFLWYTCLALAVPGMLACWRQRRTMAVFLMLFLVVFISLFGLSESNIGILIRHRDMITPAILLLAVLGLDVILRKKATLWKP